MQIWNLLQGWKTYITAIATILAALVAYLNGQLSLEAFIAATLVSVQTMNIRHAITTTTTAAVTNIPGGAKTLAVIFALLVLCGSNAMAQETATPAPTTPVSISNIFSQLPGLKQGVAYDISSGNAAYFTTVELFDKWGFSVSAGYASTSDIVASLDYDIGGLSKLGLNVPLLSAIDLRVGFYVGLADISTASSSGSAERNKFAYGPEITIVSIKF